VSRGPLPIRWTKTARDSLHRAAEHMAEDNIDAAKRWISAVAKTVDRLGQLPEMGPPLSELPQSGYRQIWVRRYRVIYRVLSNCVEVALLRHEARAPLEGVADIEEPEDE
jgi:toxin ParE1/3/4